MEEFVIRMIGICISSRNEEEGMYRHNTHVSRHHPLGFQLRRRLSKFNQLLTAMTDLLCQNATLFERVNTNHQDVPTNYYSLLPTALSHNIEKFDDLSGALTAIFKFKSGKLMYQFFQ